MISLRVLVPRRLLIPVVEPTRLALHSFLMLNVIVLQVVAGDIGFGWLVVLIDSGGAVLQFVFDVAFVLGPLVVTVDAVLVCVAVLMVECALYVGESSFSDCL